MLLDSLDTKILLFLKENCRTPFLQIARELSVSESTIRKRVSRMRERGVIRSFTVELNSTLSFESLVAIKCKPKSTKKIVAKISEINSLIPVFEVTGRFDIFCNVSAPTARELNRIIDKIRDISGVIETESFLVVEKR
ncbi:MAG: AsnC family transcriptional regulator [Candidatus Diapherotrites archaeon]|uniref:AsnC family transcriptional regulator n=1 Tax=Candidatus Iainarchaeum sp. TaxID=3101447 RepID=A0A2D6LZS8_9ARCH|nr:AsnC family transcriptional regulator [Candidatus Diapherotrites archaeon]|tara:strand:- start:28 stop:441 length:414 start_codon:yes stop_codon:yes gene_type:complete